jgi:hypothetical protein
MPLQLFRLVLQTTALRVPAPLEATEWDMVVHVLRRFLWGPIRRQLEKMSTMSVRWRDGGDDDDETG